MMRDYDVEVDAKFFLTVERQQRLDLILHLIPNSKQPILLRGPEQSGKTFFLKVLLQQQANKHAAFELSLRHAFDKNDVFTEIKEVFDAAENSNKQPQSRLKAWSNIGNITLFIVEDVHLLNAGLLGALLDLNKEYGCVRLILSSSENLGEEIEQQCQLIDLEPFSQKQTSEYARARIDKKGRAFEGLSGIDDVVLFIETGGLPGRINDVLEQVLLNPRIEKESKFMPKKMALLFVMGLALIIIAVSSFFWNQDEVIVTGVDMKRLEPAPVKQVVEKDEKIELSLVKKQAESTKKQVSIKKAAIEPIKESMLSKIENKITDKMLSNTKVVLPKPKESKVEELTQARVEKPKVEIAEISKKEVKVSVVKKAVLLNSVKAPASRLEKDLFWIQQRAPKHYTLQLLGLSSDTAALKYLANKESLSDLYYYQSQAKKGRWYTIIYGDYPSKAAAEKAAKDLPRTLGKSKPWVRSFSSIQKSVYQQ